MIHAGGKREAERRNFTLPLAKHLLASQLGITSETLSRILSRLREKRLAVIEGLDLCQIDQAGLRLFLAEVEDKARTFNYEN